MEQKSALERFLYHRVYRHPDIVRQRSIAQDRLRQLFAILLRTPERLPPRFQDWAESVGIARAVGDYLAGMTDRYCERQYRRLSS